MAKTNLANSPDITSTNLRNPASLSQPNLAQRFVTLREELAAERALQEQRERIEMELATTFETQKIVSALQEKLRNRIDPWADNDSCCFSVPSQIGDMVAERTTAETGLLCSVHRDIMSSMIIVLAP